MIDDNKRGVSVGLSIVNVFTSRTICNKPIQKQKSSFFMFHLSMKLDFGVGLETSVEVVVDQCNNRLQNFEINLLFQNVSMFGVDVGHIRIEIESRIT
jgi:type II secretory pathway component PulF